MADNILNFNNLSDRAKQAFFNQVNQEISGENIASGTPVNAVAATATITSDGTAPTAGDTVTIGDIVYTFVDALTTDPAEVPYEVLIGISAAVALDNLKSAINATTGEGTVYGTGTVAHPDVTATTNDNTTQLVVANVAGTIGNAIAKVEDSTHLDWDGAGAVFTGGVDGTVAEEGALLFDATYLYIAIAANTTADGNWRRIAVGSAF